MSVRVEAVLSGRLSASSRFRVLQHVGPLDEQGIAVRAVPPRISKYAWVPSETLRRGSLAPAARLAMRGAKMAVRIPAVARSWSADVTWLEREMLPGRRTLEPLLHRPLLFDVDDAIWMLSPGHERAARNIAARSTCVLAGNDFLADWFATWAPEVQRVWTAVDTVRFAPAPRPLNSFVVGWTGSASTLRYLESVADPLAGFMAEVPEARLLVMADMAPAMAPVPPERLDFVRWHPDTEARVLRGIDVGLMPLPDTDWGRGKCAFKMLQYMACGVPVVVSPVGMSAQILAMADVGLAAGDVAAWRDALFTLYRDRDRAAAMGATARALAEERFSLPVISGQLAERMRRYA